MMSVAKMTTSVEDQLDVEGWEIANENRQSPEIADVDLSSKLNHYTPDVVQKAQQHRDSDEKGLLRCPVCLHGFKFLKNLGCQCNVCMNCATSLLADWRDGSEYGEDEAHYKKTRMCTVCDQEHAVPSLVHTMLKPVFEHDAVKCMSCCGRKDTQDAWWCQDCSLILCSKCAHKAHRDHVTLEFDQDYDAVRFCLSMFHLDGQETASRFKTMTWAKFEQIFKVIESAIDTELESQNKMRRARLTDVFGYRATNQGNSASDYEKLHRRLSVIQQRGIQQFPLVLDEILSLSGLGPRETVRLQTDIVAEKIVDLLKSTVDQLSLDDFKLITEQQTASTNESDADGNHKPIMYVGDSNMAIDSSDNGERHY